MTNLIAHIRDVIDQHPKSDCGDDAGLSCGCGERIYLTTPAMWRRRSSTGLD